MTRCKYIDCKNKVSKLIGYCKGCDEYHCHQHRLPETHGCKHLIEFQLQAKQNLEKRLLSEYLVDNRVSKI